MSSVRASQIFVMPNTLKIFATRATNLLRISTIAVILMSTFLKFILLQIEVYHNIVVYICQNCEQIINKKEKSD